MAQVSHKIWAVLTLGAMLGTSQTGLSSNTDLDREPAGIISDAQMGLFSQLQTQINHTVRMSHAREMFGRQYAKSPAKSTEKFTEIRPFLYRAVQASLPKKYKKHAFEIAASIVRESEHHGFDPLFLMAVIQNESAFDVKARGSVGEIGLMQIRPSTARWLCPKYGFRYRGDKQLENPQFNIQLGSAYLAELRGRFRSDGKLALAAFNMGSSNVRQALSKNIRPKDYSDRVMKRYVRYYQELKNQMEARSTEA